MSKKIKEQIVKREGYIKRYEKKIVYHQDKINKLTPQLIPPHPGQIIRRLDLDHLPPYDDKIPYDMPYAIYETIGEYIRAWYAHQIRKFGYIMSRHFGGHTKTQQIVGDLWDSTAPTFVPEEESDKNPDKESDEPSYEIVLHDVTPNRYNQAMNTVRYINLRIKSGDESYKEFTLCRQTLTTKGTE